MFLTSNPVAEVSVPNLITIWSLVSVLSIIKSPTELVTVVPPDAPDIANVSVYPELSYPIDNEFEFLSSVYICIALAAPLAEPPAIYTKATGIYFAKLAELKSETNGVVAC